MFNAGIPNGLGEAEEFVNFDLLNTTAQIPFCKRTIMASHVLML